MGWFGFDVFFHNPLMLLTIAFSMVILGIGIGILLAVTRKLAQELLQTNPALPEKETEAKIEKKEVKVDLFNATKTAVEVADPEESTPSPQVIEIEASKPDLPDQTSLNVSSEDTIKRRNSVIRAPANETPISAAVPKIVTSADVHEERKSNYFILTTN